MHKILYRETTHISSVLAPCDAVDTEEHASFCAGWKAQGFCEHTHVDWMHKNCNKTCTC